jgi:hypothetical protein
MAFELENPSITSLAFLLMLTAALLTVFLLIERVVLSMRWWANWWRGRRRK